MANPVPCEPAGDPYILQVAWSTVLPEQTLRLRRPERLIGPAKAKNCSVSSQSPDLQTNSDGSVDLYFGPTAPAGTKSNWIDTGPSRNFEVLFRLYGPTKPLFEKTWSLPDIEKA